LGFGKRLIAGGGHPEETTETKKTNTPFKKHRTRLEEPSSRGRTGGGKIEWTLKGGGHS